VTGQIDVRDIVVLDFTKIEKCEILEDIEIMEE